jgi:hypothetical protein
VQKRRRRASRKRRRRRKTTHPTTMPAIGPGPSLDLEEEEEEGEESEEEEVGVGVMVTVVPVGPGVVMVIWLGAEVVLDDEGAPEMASTWVLWEMKRGVAGMAMERAARGASRADLWLSIPLAACSPSTLKSGL